MDDLYLNIQALCQQNGIRPGRLCDELGISRGLMTDLKMGRKKSISAETAQKIAGYFGVSVGYLLGQGEQDLLDEADIAFYGQFRELTDSQMSSYVWDYSAYPECIGQETDQVTEATEIPTEN